MHDPSAEASLFAGLLSHLARYLDTGCPRAAHEAGVLLRELDTRPIDQELIRSCEQLEQAIFNRPQPVPAWASAAAGGRDKASTSRPLRSRSSHVCGVQP